MSEYCLQLKNITKVFGSLKAVNDVSVELVPGKVYGLVGPNGAGKSTLMGLIMGSLNPSSGEGNVYGYPLGSVESLRLLGYSPEFTSFYSDMTVVEYLYYMATLAGLSNKEAMDKTRYLIEKFNLTESTDRKVAKFSTGMKKKVSLAQAMIHDPKILLLDEPTANLDPTSRQEILDTVRTMVNEENLTVVISSHVLTELETVIDHLLMLDHGQLIIDAPIEEAQERFKQGVLLVDCSDNELLMQQLANYDCQMENDHLTIRTSEMVTLKKEIVQFVVSNDLTLNMLNEEKISLDNLYKQVMEGEKQHESSDQTNITRNS